MLYEFARGLLRPVFKFFYRIKVEGVENLPEDGPFIICSNHTSSIDPIFIGVSLPVKRIYSMAKVELFKNKFIGYILRNLHAFPVKRGEADLGSIKNALKLLNDRKILGIFPEGTRNKSEDVKAEPGIAMLSIKSRAPIVPVAIKSNYKFFNKTILYVGKPLSLEQYYDVRLKTEDYTRISFDIMKSIKETQKGENSSR